MKYDYMSIEYLTSEYKSDTVPLEKLRKEAADLREALAQPPTKTPVDLNVLPELVSSSNRGIILGKELDALMQHIEAHVAMSKSLGGGELGMIELQLTDREWEVLKIELSWRSNRHTGSDVNSDLPVQFRTHSGSVRLVKEKV